MGERTGIEWTDATWNPVSGCSKVSQGCKHCYAERVFHRPYPGRKFTDVRVHEDRLQQPLHWTKGRRIFVNSMSDLFHEDLPFEFIAKVFAVMACTTRHTYQILTKRPQRLVQFFGWLRDEGDDEVTALDPAKYGLHFWPEQVRPTEVWPDWIPWRAGRRGGYDNCGPIWPLVNVWLGVSVEDQETAAERIPLLLQTPARVRFLSCEPLLGPINLRHLDADGRGHREYCQVDALTGRHTDMGRPCEDVPHVDWVIAGGESGPKARPPHPDWFRSLRDQCIAARVPFFFKQWGEWLPICGEPATRLNDGREWHADRKSVVLQLDGRQEFAFPPGAMTCIHMGKKAAGRILDGRTWDEFPAVQP